VAGRGEGWSECVAVYRVSMSKRSGRRARPCSPGQCMLQKRRTLSTNLGAAFFSHENVEILSSVFIALFVFSNLIWLSERTHNPVGLGKH
jgi:hypothetical protein